MGVFDVHPVERGDADRRALRMQCLRARLEHDRAATLLEWALWAALFHVGVGVLYAGTHIELMTQLEAHLSGRFSPFADHAALAAMVIFWPVLLGGAWLCGVAGCGTF